MRFLVVTLVCGLLAAQQQAPPTEQKPQEPAPVRIVTGVLNIVAPTVVLDRDDNYVSGIRPDQFRLWDNEKEQNIHVDETFVPISMVIAIQCNGEVDNILPQVNRIGNLISPMLLGQQGEAAVIAFDSRVRTMQDFTSDPDKITAALKKIQSGSMSARLVDAVDAGVRMLKSRDLSRRRIILLISESRDQGSEGKGRQTVIDLQFQNVTVYAVPMSRLVGKLTAPAPYPRSDPNPPAQYTLPGGKVSTPTTMTQTGMGVGDSASFLPLLLEIYRDAKAIFKAPSTEVFAKATGGAEFSFYGGHGLEQAIQR
ncbi:MAG TPA: VWA domain-containing protein, partial [Candidatus Sulfopaludibacter sp.]|nr:VWA domain-containing protein [Candidatus Sulfopaludibacter sp.]